MADFVMGQKRGSHSQTSIRQLRAARMRLLARPGEIRHLRTPPTANQIKGKCWEIRGNIMQDRQPSPSESEAQSDSADGYQPDLYNRGLQACNPPQSHGVGHEKSGLSCQTPNLLLHVRARLGNISSPTSKRTPKVIQGD